MDKQGKHNYLESPKLSHELRNNWFWIRGFEMASGVYVWRLIDFPTVESVHEGLLIRVVLLVERKYRWTCCCWIQQKGQIDCLACRSS